MSRPIHALASTRKCRLISRRLLTAATVRVHELGINHWSGGAGAGGGGDGAGDSGGVDAGGDGGTL
eukprot:CAMPEP_0185784520 /NCGR_PEP_ID=MMETSP1174-20130828/123673_1 /TAXON_ID=35687 /ORGANISM="Dictyocha speculum, Strain CCMP1381" /LENGTH=65 /DNA_ID=CAMNT_0028476141 /DNA_START=626 /DNA_END=820 /DNA_ORIENTATION=-